MPAVITLEQKALFDGWVKVTVSDKINSINYSIA